MTIVFSVFANAAFSTIRPVISSTALNVMSFLQRVAKVSFIAIVLQMGGSLPAASQTNQNFLWSVETPTNTVYLLGSIHMLKAEDYPLAQPIQDAFQDAENVVFEVDFSTLRSEEAVAIMHDSALPDSDEERLQTALSPESYALAQDAATEVGLPIANFNNFEPWFFSITLTVVKLSQLGFSGEYGVDAFLFQQAVNMGKEIIALETTAEQMGIFDSLSIETQQALVEQTIADLEIIETSFEDMRTAWRMGDVDAMEGFILSSLEDFPDVETALFTQRNQNWLAQIATMLNQDQDYLVVVGAGHLVGETGLVQQLQAGGYTVEQL